MRSLQCGMVFLLSLVTGNSEGYGQVTESNRLLSAYDSIIGVNNLGLVNGVRHSIAFVSRKTHPYHGTNAWEKGQITLTSSAFPGRSD